MASTVQAITGERTRIPVEIGEDARAMLDEHSFECVDRTATWAVEHAAGYGVQLDAVRVYRWQSVEDADFVLVIIELSGAGRTEAMHQYWDAAGQILDGAINENPTPSTEFLTLHVRWTNPAHQ